MGANDSGIVNPVRPPAPPRGHAVADQSSVLIPSAVADQLLAPLYFVLQDYPGATELVMNRPGRVIIQANGQWFPVETPKLTYAWAEGMAVAVGRFSKQLINSANPMLSAPLPRGERLQIVLPPVVEQGLFSLTLRLPSTSIKALEAYDTEGYFDRFAWGFNESVFNNRRCELAHDEVALLELLQQRKLKDFFRRAVLAKKTIAVVGDTGSGKTTLMKTLCQSIPADERLITIEDVRELQLPLHDNRVHMLYSKGGQGQAVVSPAALVAATLRMLPSRILLAELRESEAFDFLNLLMTGHPGSITSFHASSCGMARWRYAIMCGFHSGGEALGQQALREMVDAAIHIIVHVVRDIERDSSGKPTGKESRYIKQIHFDPFQRLDAEIGQGATMKMAGGGE